MNLVRMFAQASVLASMVLASLSIYSNPASAQQRACVITDEGATVCGKLTTQMKKPTSSVEQRKELGNFVLLLKGCRRSDTTIKCNLSVTNEGEEKQLWIEQTNSTIVDSDGKSYRGSTVSVGGKSAGSLLTTISPGINYAAVITFKNISQQIAQVPLLNLALHDTSNSHNIQFRNVYFSN